MKMKIMLFTVVELTGFAPIFLGVESCAVNLLCQFLVILYFGRVSKYAS